MTGPPRGALGFTAEELAGIRALHVEEYDTDENFHPAPRCATCTVLPPPGPQRFYGAFAKVRWPCPTVRLVDAAIAKHPDIPDGWRPLAGNECARVGDEFIDDTYTRMMRKVDS